MLTDVICLHDTMARVWLKSSFSHHWPFTQLCCSPSPFPVCRKKHEVSLEEGRWGEEIFQTISFFLIPFFKQRTPESLNDKVFEGKTFKDDLFQPCHLALVVTETWASICGKRRLDLDQNPRARVLAPPILWLQAPHLTTSASSAVNRTVSTVSRPRSEASATQCRRQL